MRAAGNKGGNQRRRSAHGPLLLPTWHSPASGDHHAGEMARCAQTPFPGEKSNREKPHQGELTLGAIRALIAAYQRALPEVLKRPESHLSHQLVGDPGSLVQLCACSSLCQQPQAWLVSLPALLLGEVCGTTAPTFFWEKAHPQIPRLSAGVQSRPWNHHTSLPSWLCPSPGGWLYAKVNLVDIGVLIYGMGIIIGATSLTGVG